MVTATGTTTIPMPTTRGASPDVVRHSARKLSTASDSASSRPSTTPPSYEPDDEWKATLRARISVGFDDLVRSAKVKLEEEIQINPSNRAQLVQDFERNIEGIKGMATEQYQNELMAERAKRGWAGGFRLGAYEDMMRKEQESILDAIKREQAQVGTPPETIAVEPNTTEAITTETTCSSDSPTSSLAEDHHARQEHEQRETSEKAWTGMVHVNDKGKSRAMEDDDQVDEVPHSLAVPGALASSPPPPLLSRPTPPPPIASTPSPAPPGPSPSPAPPLPNLSTKPRRAPSLSGLSASRPPDLDRQSPDLPRQEALRDMERSNRSDLDQDSWNRRGGDHGEATYGLSSAG